MGVPMPLSDRERKQLEELEADLAADDPRLAQRLSSGSLKSRLKARMSIGALVCLIGLVVLIAGVSTQIVVVGVGGFLVMGAGAYLLVGAHSFRFPKSPKSPDADPKG